jgi:hypothetical protein
MSKKGNKHEKAKTLVTGLLVTMAQRERERERESEACCPNFY